MAATEWQRAMVVAKLKELEEVKPGKQEAVYERLRTMALGGDGGKVLPGHENSARALHYSNWDNVDFDLVLEELKWGDRKESRERSRRLRRALSKREAIQKKS